MKTVKSIIAEHPLLRSMSPAHLDILAECGQEVVYEAEQTIFRQGEPADRLFLILEGKVILELHEPGQGDREVQLLGPGDVLGWSWLFQPFVWHYQARAVERAVAISFNGAHLLIACERNHDLGYELMKRMAQVVIQRLQATRRQLVDLRSALPQA